MYFLIPLLLASTALAAPAKRQSPCTDIHIFLSKGWNEPYPGRQGALAGAICAGLPDVSCDYEDILFSNTPEDDYCASVTEGNTNGVAQMNAYAERCPDSRLVLTGYSQGANVAGDILGGGGGRFGNETVYCEVGQTAGLDPETGAGSMCKPPHLLYPGLERLTYFNSGRRANMGRQPPRSLATLQCSLRRKHQC